MCQPACRHVVHLTAKLEEFSYLLLEVYFSPSGMIESEHVVTAQTNSIQASQDRVGFTAVV